MLIVDVPLVRVIPVVVPISHTVPTAVIAQVLVPIRRARVFELLEEKVPALTVKVTALKVPWVRVNVLVIAKASASVTVIPEPLTVIPDIVLPMLVTVALAKNVGKSDV
jgi:hypothetical protein